MNGCGVCDSSKNLTAPQWHEPLSFIEASSSRSVDHSASAMPARVAILARKLEPASRALRCRLGSEPGMLQPSQLAAEIPGNRAHAVDAGRGFRRGVVVGVRVHVVRV